MRTLLKTLFFFLLLTQICFGQWVVNQPLTNLNQNDVCYSGEEQVFIVCDNGYVLETRNSGASWSKQQLTENSNLNAIFLVDEFTGFIAGNNGKIFKTENSCYDWIDISIDPYFHIKDIAFLDHINGIVAGTKEVRIDGKTYFLPAILITSDAGVSWIDKKIDIRGKLNSVTYLADGIVLAVGDSGLILKSPDNGSTWIKVQINVFNNLNIIRVCPDFTTIISGDNGTFLYSPNLGESWYEVYLPSYYHIKGACFNMAGEIVAASSKEVRIDGKTYYMATILNIEPLGNYWREEFSQVRGEYNSVSFCNSGLAIAIGDSGLISVYDKASSVKGNNDIVINDYNLYQNYPNPFNPSTIISWQSPIGSWQTLKVYDMLGNEIATLVDEYKPAGKYELEFNAASHSGEVRNLSSGIYFYRLNAGSFNETKKMILLR